MARPRPRDQPGPAHKKVKIGYDYVHSMVDDHSRLAYSEILPDEKGPTCAGFIARAAAFFAGHGITSIERVITDNHFSYRKSTHVKAAVEAVGAKHKFIRPHCPWQNGKVERFNRTLATEWAYRQVFTSNDERAAALAPWLGECGQGVGRAARPRRSGQPRASARVGGVARVGDMAQQIGTPGGTPERPALFFGDAAEFGRWLAAHHDTERELWMGFYRKGHPQAGAHLGASGARGALLGLDRQHGAGHRRAHASPALDPPQDR